MSEPSWYIEREDGVEGPLTEPQLRKRYRGGLLTARDRIKDGPDGTWLVVGEAHWLTGGGLPQESGRGAEAGKRRAWGQKAGGPSASAWGRPVFAWTILAACIVVYVHAGIRSESLWRLKAEVLVDLGALFIPLVGAGEYWRMFACMFLHSAWWHIGMNGYVLYGFGYVLEELFGRWRFLAIYLLSGLGASFTSVILHVVTGEGYVSSVGASGALFGLVGAAVALAVHGWKLRMKDAYGQFAYRLLMFAGVWVGLGFLTRGFDNWAHLGGFVFGFLFAKGLPARRFGVDRQAPAKAMLPVALLFFAGAGALAITSSKKLAGNEREEVLAYFRWAYNPAVTLLPRQLVVACGQEDWPKGDASRYAQQLEQLRQAREKLAEYSPSAPEVEELQGVALVYFETLMQRAARHVEAALKGDQVPEREDQRLMDQIRQAGQRHTELLRALKVKYGLRLLRSGE